MAFSQYPLAVSIDASIPHKTSILASSSSSSLSSGFLHPLASSSPSSSSTPSLKTRVPKLCSVRHKANAQPQETDVSSAADASTQFKHLLLPITDPNPYLSEGTREAIAACTVLAKSYGSDLTVIVINDKPKESLPDHDTQLSSIHWHLTEGGFQEYKLFERLGEEGNKPTAIIGEVADDLHSDLVVMSMEAIHSKHVDANLLAEFIPCPVLLLPL